MALPSRGGPWAAVPLRSYTDAPHLGALVPQGAPVPARSDLVQSMADDGALEDSTRVAKRVWISSARRSTNRSIAIVNEPFHVVFGEEKSVIGEPHRNGVQCLSLTAHLGGCRWFTH